MTPVPPSCPAQDAAPDPLAWLLANCQADGSVRIHPEPAAHLDAQPIYRIEPYFASLGLWWAHRASPARLQAAVGRWLAWWFEHRNPATGTPLNHYTCETGAMQRTALPASGLPAAHEDATDSNAALWYLLLHAYLQHGGAQAWHALPLAVRRGLHAPLLALFDLMDDDGLSWAKADYPVKYLMDNAEVCAGLRAAHAVLRDWGCHSLHRHLLPWSAELARNSHAALQTLDQPALGLWATAQAADGSRMLPDLCVAYPDCNAQLWPGLFGLESPHALSAWPTPAPGESGASQRTGLVTGEQRALQRLGRVAKAHPQWTQERFSPETTADIHLALAAKAAGWHAEVHQWCEAVAPSFVQTARESETGQPCFRWPFTVAEAGMLHWLMHPGQSAEA